MVKMIFYWGLLMLISANLILADDTISESKIEQLLKTKNLDKEKLLIPKDRLDYFKNRYVKIEEYFANPAKSFSSINIMAENYNKLSTLDLIKEGIEIIGAKKVREIPLSSSISTTIMNIELGTNIDSLIDYKSSLILRPYLNILINAQTLIIKDPLQKDNESSRFLRVLSENLLQVLKNENKDFTPENFDKQIAIVEQSNIYDIAYNLYKELSINNERLKKLPNEMTKDVKTSILNTKYGKIAIGGKGNDVYTGNFIAIIDLGGDDTYNLEQFDSQLSYYSPIRFIIDCSGNDNYKGKDFNIGSGYFGVNFIIDNSGNDTYSANNYSIASGIFGVGIIDDADGNDKYINNNFGIAASFYGIGILNDNKGDDTYESFNYSQSFSSTKGLSILRDNQGDDKYLFKKNGGEYNQASTIGNRISGSGSLSFLLDNAGNDNYLAKYKSQSYAGQNGISVLLDKSGSDYYNSLIFSQASAAQYSIALLRDYLGNDTYSQVFSFAANTSYYSYSLFNDNNGDDYYIESTNYGNQNYASFFIDEIGKDTIKFNRNYIKKEQNYLPTIGRLNFISNELIKSATNDSTSVEKLLNINDKVIQPAYSKNLHDAIAKFVTDTLLFEQVKDSVDKLNHSDKAIFAYHYIKSAKNDNLTQACFEYLFDENDFISQSAFDAIILNPSFKSDLLLKLIGSELKLIYKKELVNYFATMNFNQQSVKEFRNSIIKLPNELKELIYPELKKNQSGKGMKSKLKDLIKSEKDVDLKKLLQNEK